jgi:hypothetical protein
MSAFRGLLASIPLLVAGATVAAPPAEKPDLPEGVFRVDLPPHGLLIEPFTTEAGRVIRITWGVPQPEGPRVILSMSLPGPGVPPRQAANAQAPGPVRVEGKSLFVGDGVLAYEFVPTEKGVSYAGHSIYPRLWVEKDAELPWNNQAPVKAADLKPGSVYVVVQGLKFSPPPPGK